MAKFLGWRWRLRQWRRQWLRLWYRWRYGISVNEFSGSLLPELGPGQFVSVYQKGPYIDVVAHRNYPGAPSGTIRIIPVQYNHGVFIEFVNDDGTVACRAVVDYQRLYQILGARAEANPGDSHDGERS